MLRAETDLLLHYINNIEDQTVGNKLLDQASHIIKSYHHNSKATSLFSAEPIAFSYFCVGMAYFLSDKMTYADAKD